MKVLIIGAGAVGQVYGYHLHQGGAEICFYIKEKYAADLDKGFELYQHSLFGKILGGRTQHGHFNQFSYISSVEALEAQSFDYIINTVSSTALRSGWWESFKNASGSANIVGLQPALDDTQFILQTLPVERYIKGLVQFVAYQSPLPGGHEPSGLHYILLPISGLFENENARASALMKTLKKGAFRTKHQNNLNFYSSRHSSITIPLTAALEQADWKIAKLLQAENLHAGLQAAKESNLAVSQVLQQKGIPSFFLKPGLIRLILRLMPLVFPFDIEVYLKYHFTKVGDQTRLMLEQYIAHAKKHELAHEANRHLLDVLEAIDKQQAA
jgi:ketopantoate reductase